MDLQKYEAVRNFVLCERQRRGIRDTDLSTGSKPEGSCIAFGEAYNFVECQLMRNHESCSSTWSLMRKDPEILELAYNYSVFGIRSGIRIP